MLVGLGLPGLPLCTDAAVHEPQPQEQAIAKATPVMQVIAAGPRLC
jgi:hypothetical protein